MAHERVARYVNWLKGYRPRGVIEIVTNYDEDEACDGEYAEYEQHIRWEPYLEDLGFRVVTSCYNSNSGNIIHIWHLPLGEVS